MFRTIVMAAGVILAVVAQPVAAQSLAEQQEALLSEQERKALQDAMVWAGTYEGRIDGAFGPATRRAIAEFQRNEGFRDTGYLRQRHVDRLLEERMEQTQRYGWQVRRFPDLGMQMGIPTALFGEPEPTEIGLRYRSKPNEPKSELLLYSAVPMSDARFDALRDDMVDRQAFGRDVYQSGGDDWFVFSGTSGKGVTQYTYAVNRNAGVRGFSFRYMAKDADALERLNVAMYNSLETFPAESKRPDPGQAEQQPQASGGGLLFSDEELKRLAAGDKAAQPQSNGRRGRRSTGILVSPDGGILTTAGAVQNCERVRVNDRVDAKIRVVDQAHDLAVLSVDSDGREFPYVRWRGAPVREGDEIRVFSYTQKGGELEVQKGKVESLTGPNGDFTRFQVGVPLKRGSRGAPVLDKNERVVGLVHGEGVSRAATAADDDRELGRNERLATAGLVAQTFLAARAPQYRARLESGDIPDRITRRATVMLECVR